MVKRFFLDERPEGRSEAEQAKINEQNFEVIRQTMIKVSQGAADYMHRQQEISAALRKGSIALASEELSTLEFNEDYTVAKYDGKEVKFKKGGLENEMLSILGRATNSKNKTVIEQQLVGSLERATDKDCEFKMVRNTRDRLNAKFQSGLGLPDVVKLDDGKYGLEERYLRLPKK